MTIKSRLRKHLLLLEFTPQEINLTISTLIRWIEHSGVEWLVSRLKAVKLTLLHFWAGDPDYLVHAPWFKVNGKGLKGIFRFLFKTQNPKRHLRRKMLAFLNIAKVFVCSKSQVELAQQDSIDNITKPYKGKPIKVCVKNPFPEFFRYKMGYKLNKPVVPTSIVGLHTSKPDSVIGKVIDNPFLSSILDTVDSSFEHYNYKVPDYKKSLWNFNKFSTFGGNLHFLAEPGLKVRTIAIPIAEHQVVLKPFHDYLSNILIKFNEDCTFDQDKGARKCQSWLKEGLTLHSIDLKSATERFPLDLQLYYAKYIGVTEEWINTFKLIARLDFSCNEQLVQYEVGQPMGLYGSFPLLALGQHGLVRQAGEACGKSSKGKYVVLGDDIVIADEDIAREYRNLLKHYDIPVSENKCIISNKIAEFAGFVINPLSIDKGAKPSNLKSSNINHYINYCITLGRIPETVPQFMKEILFPLVYSKEENGGLGFNPHGLTSEERELFYDPLYEKESSMKVESFKSYLRRTLYHFYDEFNEIQLSLMDNLWSHIDNLEHQFFSKKEKVLSRYIDLFSHYTVNNVSGIYSVVYSEKLEQMYTHSFIKNKYPYYFLSKEMAE